MSSLAPSATPTPQPTSQAADTSARSLQPPIDSFQPTISGSTEQDVVESNIIRPGAVVDGYVVIEILDRGGMGVVFKARQPDTDQLVAVKLIRDGNFADQDSLDRFEQEFRVLGKMQPVKNIVPIYHVGHYNHECYFVMRYMAGGSLSTQLKRHQQDRRMSVALVEKIARAVHQLHAQKILHRDIKPGNILLDAEDEPFLSDFGLIKLLDDNQSLTRTNQFAGTPPYMAPEQTGLVAASASAQTDIWALGVVLYELVVGSRPFDAGKDEPYPAALLRKIVSENPKMPRAVRPDLDRGLEAVIVKCLEKDPADRFGRAEELADELARWLRSEPVRTRPPGVPILLWRRARPHRWRIGFFGLVSILLGSLFGYYWFVAAVPRIERPNPNEPTTAELWAEIPRQFAAATPVELLPEKGLPKFYEWAHRDSGTMGNSRDGFCQVSAKETGLLVLAKNLPGRAYRLRAQIRHDLDDSFMSQTGLFVGLHPSPAEPASPRLYYHCNFNDLSNAKDHEKFGKNIKIPGNQFQLNYHLHADVGLPNAYDRQNGLTKPVFFVPAVRHGKWRNVALEVYEDRLVAFFEAEATPPLLFKKTEEVLKKEILDLIASGFPTHPPLQAEFSHEGSMGIYVFRGIASFKNVVVEPIVSQNP